MHVTILDDELPSEGTHFWRQINTLEAQNVSYFPLSTIRYGFSILNRSLDSQFRLQWEN